MKSIGAYLLAIFVLISSVIFFTACQYETIDIIPPEEVYNVKIIYYADSLLLEWKDPIDNDFNSIEIEVGNDLVKVDKGIQRKSFADIHQDIEYEFLIKTIDNSGNKSHGVSIIGMYDYRKEFLGSFEFLSYTTINHLTTVSYYDSVFYFGKVFYDNDKVGIIKIEYKPGEQTRCDSSGLFTSGGYILPSINAYGIMFYPEIEDCNGNFYFQGEFQNNDKLIFWIGHNANKMSSAQIVEGIRTDKVNSKY